MTGTQGELSNRKVLVTGSTRGIGLAIAARLAWAGAEVLIHGRDKTTVDELRCALGDRILGGRIGGVAADLAVAEDADRAFAEAGPVDILVNNAGIFDGARSPLDLTDDEWLRMMNVNLLGPVRAIRHFAPAMVARGWGRIVNISSEAGAAPVTDLLHYSASKAALNSMSRGFAQALAGTGVTVNTVIAGPTAHDGATQSRRVRAAEAGLSYEEYMKAFFAEHRPSALLGRYVEAEEIAELVAFIVSDRASFASGAPWRAECGSMTAIS